MSKVWIMIKTNCMDCGDEMFLQVLSKKPTDSEVQDFMPGEPDCGIRTFAEAEIDGELVKPEITT